MISCRQLVASNDVAILTGNATGEIIQRDHMCMLRVDKAIGFGKETSVLIQSVHKSY